MIPTKPKQLKYFGVTVLSLALVFVLHYITQTPALSEASFASSHESREDIASTPEDLSSTSGDLVSSSEDSGTSEEENHIESSEGEVEASQETSDSTDEVAASQDSVVEEGSNFQTKPNLMFVKTHKCGTSTLVNVFYLLGVRRRLNFVINPYTHKINVNGRLLPPRPGGHYNIQCQHGTFRPGSEHEVLPKETSLYVTILRSPVSHFTSAFNFFGAVNMMRKKYGEQKFDVLVGKYLSEKAEAERPVINTVVNSAASDLGYKTFAKALPSDMSLEEKISSFVSHIDKELDFVMITERMDESLVILKEYLGWELSDLFYLNRMVSSKPKAALSEKTQERVLELDAIDRQLYEHFNRTFEQHIEKVGRKKVQTLLEEFRKMRNEFEDKCFDKTREVKLGPYGSASWALSDYGLNENQACSFLQQRDVILTNAITDLQISYDYKNINACKNAGNCIMQDTIRKIQQDYDKNRIT